ncbi:nucleoside/nucleotide kinase family protein [Georgenia sp. H159]|uniref:nucleoside/nucleotide kinase family protein n=1 Tax=Georgenia sp. H159 TaxID=3076115 RepID=UPI002D77EC7D|nr:nucleoside/nucleotide kinase family protein [Georgenia sp. H159]
MSGGQPPPTDVLDPDLLERARALAAGGGRRVLGITGAPGAGKSTLAHALVDALGEQARLVGMDGFHLAEAELHRLGRHDRKGAPDTFDALGYVALLRRIRAADERVVYAPVFDRAIEEPIGCAMPVPRAVPLVVTEGNYLLVPDGDWAGVRPLLDECWYVEPPEELRISRLIARHESFGRSPEVARERSLGSDQRNAEVIVATRSRADLVIAAR